MTQLTFITQAGNIIAQGTLGQNVINLEGNYYFDRDVVKLDNLVKEANAYFCPMKKSSCDYYYLKDENGQKIGQEIAWIYEEITNSLFKSIEGKVGFYTKNLEIK